MSEKQDTERDRNYAWEALAEVTGTDWVAGKGELSIGLKTIKAQCPELTDYALADEIHRRAKMYRDVMGDEIMLTPTALAKHWKRVLEESQPKVRGTNRHSGHEDCEVCGGHRFVVVGKRRPTDTAWMQQHSIKADPDAWIEEMAPCPSCNEGCDTGFWRFNGTKFESPDSARVLELMRS